MIRVHRDGQPVTVSADATSLAKNSAEEIPEWIQTVTTGKGKEQQQFLVCNDREHLLFYVQIGCLEFKTGLSRLGAKSLAPDYLVLGIESPDYELTRAVKAALAAKEILMRLQLPSFVKADGGSGLHIYIPLDSKSGFEASNRVAEYLCKLVQLKVRDLVSLKGPNDNVYTKVALNYLVNEKDQYVIAPFSLVAPSANVATPLLWDEVREGLTADAFNHDTIFKRLKKEGDPFESLLRKKVNADALLEKMEEHYSFLF
jgi:bifunctional non-homologous end joining protein LigD